MDQDGDYVDDNVMKKHSQEEDGLFEDLSHKWSNFLERGAELLGYDGDRFEKVHEEEAECKDSDNWMVNFIMSCGLKKSTLVTIAQFLITFYFITDAMMLIMDPSAL